MIVVPAIDVRRGKVVRLRQGRAAGETVYDPDPAEVARRWAGEGKSFMPVCSRELDDLLMIRDAYLGWIKANPERVDEKF